jgi:pilus assembly protein TadC
MAHIKQRPDEFIKKILQGSFILSVSMGVFTFFMADVFNFSMIFVPLVIIVLFWLFFMVLLQSPKTKIKKRQRDLDREVLFAGRYLLVKLNSGRPLLNSLVDASKSYGVSSKYFKEIVDDVTMGTPIEKALDNAIKFTPSEKFRRILFQISNAIKIGADVTEPLIAALDEISKEQMIDIQRYGKKLSSLTMFYMLLAIIMPSLGMAMLVVIGSLLGLLTEGVATSIFTGVLIALALIQFVFITIFKSNRLTVNL